MKEYLRLNIIIEKYASAVLDLINNTTENDSKKQRLLENILLKITKDAERGRVKSSIKEQIYKRALYFIKKVSPKKQLKKNDDDFNIEDYESKSIIDIDKTLNALSTEEKIVLCLINRHKLNINEVSNLLSKSTGTILNIYKQAKDEIAIHTIKNNNLPELKEEKKENCFFIHNIEPKYHNEILNSYEKKQVEEHLAMCSSCSNYYNWHKNINESIARESFPKIPDNLSHIIFKKRIKFSFFSKIKYFLKNHYIPRLLILLILILATHFVIKNFIKTNFNSLMTNLSE